VRLQSQQYVRTIYHVDVDDEPVRVQLPGDGGTAVMYRVKLVGASFALNQIRKMMGLVLSVLHGTVPERVLTIGIYIEPKPLT
jgi:tRNA U38,U39,U40 pseudouridine synthase TruA